MRVNVYSEELSDRIEIIEKTTADGKFTGLRIYLELPVTVNVCRWCDVIERTHRETYPDADLVHYDMCRGESGRHEFAPRQLSGPFMHYLGDDDSSAVTFWGKKDLREVLKKALDMLDEHYREKPARDIPF